MKVSQLVEKLVQQQLAHGDIEVGVDTNGDCCFKTEDVHYSQSRDMIIIEAWED